MTEAETKKTVAQTPEPPPIAKATRARRRFSLAWLAPIAALVLAGVLGYQAYQQKGIAITISFPEAHGIAPDDAIMYRGLRVGTVRDVHLSDDLGNVVVLADVRRDAQRIARDGSRFWIVRPQLSLNEISGLDTILGSRYIKVEPDAVSTSGKFAFEGLDDAPLVEIVSPNSLVITLRADRRGSIVPGSPVRYRDMTVGMIRDFALAPDSTGVLITAEIDERYAVLVHENSRFWSLGEVGFKLGFRGISMDMDGIKSLVVGGVAFATPSVKRMGEPATDGHLFELEEKADDSWLKWQPEIELPTDELP